MPAIEADQAALAASLAERAAAESGQQGWLQVYTDELGRLRRARDQVESGLCLADTVHLGLYCVQLSKFKAGLDLAAPPPRSPQISPRPHPDLAPTSPRPRPHLAPTSPRPRPDLPLISP